MWNKCGALFEEQAVGGTGEAHASTASGVDDGVVIGLRVEAKKAELEPGLSFGFAMASAGIAASLCERGNDFEFEGYRRGMRHACDVHWNALF